MEYIPDAGANHLTRSDRSASASRRPGDPIRESATGLAAPIEPDTDPEVEQTRRINVPVSIDMVNVLGPSDEFLRILERELEADLHVRGNEVTLTGSQPAIALAADVITELVTVLRTGQGLTADAVERICAMLTAREDARPAEVLTHNILSNRGRTIRPKTLNQKRYVDAIDKHTVVFGIGPAGTGKTYLAVAKAVQALQNKLVTRIILTRPGGRGGGAARVPAGHPERQDRSVPAAAVRRTARHGRSGIDPPAADGRHHRGRTPGVHAR